ncbi:MAG: hypothetical protein ACREOW_10785 [Thermodesulfobacteriota bacterium]
MAKITSQNFSNVTMDEWVEEFWEVYRDQDIQRSPAEIWLMAVYDASQAGRAIREGQISYAVGRVAHAFCWIASFRNRIFKDKEKKYSHLVDERFDALSKIVWFKYPRTCPACGKQNCDCPVDRPRFNRDDWKKLRGMNWRKMPQFRGDSLPMPNTLDDWGTMFRTIYQGAHDTMRFEDIGFHFLEEMGEASEAIIHLSRPVLSQEEEKLRIFREQLYAEIADAISWLFSLVNKIDSSFRNSKEIYDIYKKHKDVDSPQISFEWSLTLSQILWFEYKWKKGDLIVCHKCQERRCDPEKCFQTLEVKEYP